MEEAPSAVGSIQGRQVFGKEAQVIREGEERREPLRPGHPCLQGVCVSAQAPAAPRQAALSPEAFPWPLRLFCRLRESSLQEFTSTETQEAFYLSGSAASLFNLTKGSLRIPGPFLDGDLTGGRSPLRLRTPGADCWLSGILILLTRKYLYLPENPLRSVGKILDMSHVAGTLENRHFLCFSIYLSTHPLSIFYLLPLFFLSSFHPSIHHPSNLFQSLFIMTDSRHSSTSFCPSHPLGRDFLEAYKIHLSFSPKVEIFLCLQGDPKPQDSPGDSSIAILLF